MTSKKIVKHAIEHQGPRRVPLYLFNRDFDRSDIIAAHLVPFMMGSDKPTDEWGLEWEQLDGTMGQPREPLLRSLEEVAELKTPDLRPQERIAETTALKAEFPDQYILASFGISGFDRICLLRGFAELMIDLAEATPLVFELIDKIFRYEEALVDVAAAAKVDAVAFFDDWGTQTGPVISPQMFREIFLPRYKRQFDLVHRLGMDVYFHSCGKIEDIIEELVTAGVDMMNISQPNCNNLELIGEKLRGRTTFVTPISYQTTSLCGTVSEIHAEARRMFNLLAGPTGGFVGYVEDYSCLGMTEENYQACINAFRQLKWKDQK